MSASSLQTMTRVNTRSIKKLEKPRPLKLSTTQSRLNIAENRLSSGGITVEEVMALADSVCQHITNGNCDRSLQSNLLTLCSSLKLYGPQLETVYKDQLDRLFVTFRNGSRDERVPLTSRVHLLELVELRGSNWSVCDNTSDYYRHKAAHTQEMEFPVLDSPVTPTGLGGLGQFGQLGPLGVLGLTPSPSPTTPQPTLLGPGEVLKTSGKFPKPTKIPNKNYCKDEVVIRNSDSGKVMGIKGRRVHMIEEMSETIISFQRVNPGAKERLVQITGPSEDKIIHARQLMEDTIRRNASPVRTEQPENARDQRETLGGSSSSLNSSASDDSMRLVQGGTRRSTLLHSFSTNDASLGEYKYTVAVRGCVLKITGSNHDLVRAAKLVLDEYFAAQDGGDGFQSSYEEELPSPPATASVPSTHTPTVQMSQSAQTVATSTAAAAVQTMQIPAPTSVTVSTSTTPLTASSSLDSSSEGDETVRAAAPSSSAPVTGATIDRRRQYTADDLWLLVSSPASRQLPNDWQRISKEFPSIVKKVPGNSGMRSFGYPADYRPVRDHSQNFAPRFYPNYAPSPYLPAAFVGEMHVPCGMNWNGWSAQHRILGRRIVPTHAYWQK